MDYSQLAKLRASDFRAKWNDVWKSQLDDDLPRYLLRGQNAFHLTPSGIPSIVSYFSRLPNERVLVGQIYTIFRRASEFCTGAWGYHVGASDALEVLQHYGWRTPSIDFSGAPDVALAFALHRSPQTPVIYVLDRSKLPPEVVVSEHDFLMAKTEDGGLASRWWRQDGFGVMNKTWHEADTTRNFNLFDAAPKAIETVAVFNDNTVPLSSYEALLDLSDDPHPERVQSTLRRFCEGQFGDRLHPQLAATIDAILP